MLAAGLQLSHIIILAVIGCALIALGTVLVILGNRMIRRAHAGTRVTLAAPTVRRRPATAGPRSYGYGPRR